MKKSILFVDDEEKEISRFREVMSHKYIVGAGRSLDEALNELKSNRVRTPDLILLDLYYGPEATPAQRQKVEVEDEKLTAAEQEVRKALADAKQEPKGGLKLAEDARRLSPSSARAFFSRKAFLRDALDAHQVGLALIEKPDPIAADDGAGKDKYREAMNRNREELYKEFDRIIGQNTFWAKHKELVIALIAGVVSACAWDVVKASFQADWKLATITSVAVIGMITFGVYLGKRL
jgi:CheY-like chemotaxis protein